MNDVLAFSGFLASSMRSATFWGGVADLVRGPVGGVTLDHVLGSRSVGGNITKCRNSLSRETWGNRRT